MIELLQKYWQAIVLWFDEPNLDDAWSVAVTAAAVGFFLKLARDFIVDKVRQAANVRVVTVYIQLAIESWEARGGIVTDPNAPLRRYLAIVPAITEKILDPQHPFHCADRELFTPFVVFSAHDNLTIAEVRDLLGFLRKKEIKDVVEFVQEEAMVHTFAEDFRGEYVRREFTQRRKVDLFNSFSDQVVKTYDAAKKARETLEPVEKCPLILWCVPYLGIWIWRALFAAYRTVRWIWRAVAAHWQ